MAKRDYYEILGVDKNADADTIKKVYRKVAMQYHPDRNPGDKASEEKFKEAAEAYDVLNDPDKKARYDRYGHAGVDPNMGAGGFRGGNGGMTMDDIFQNFGDVFGSDNPFESFFGGGSSRGGQQKQGQRGSNLRIKVKMTLEEIAKGVSKKIKVRKQVKCTSCKGSGAKDAQSTSTCSTCRGSGYVRQIKNTFLGQMQTTTTCPTCSGSGQVITAHCNTCKGDGRMWEEETIEIDIPAGVEDNMQLSLRNKGNAGPKGGPSGDLLIHIEEVKHEYLTRDGMNLAYELNLNFADATLGTSVEVPTINGKARVKIDPGTQAGKVLRLKGKGLPSVHNAYSTGDQLIYVNIYTPKDITAEERTLLEKMRNMPNFQPKSEKSEKGFFERMKDIFS